MARMSSSETNAARTRTGSGSASSRTIADARAGRGVGGDLVAERAAVAGAVAEHHVGLGGLIEAQGDLVGEQVADVQDFLARVLQRGDDAVADGAALGGEGGQRGEGAFFEFAVGLVGGQERDLVDQDHDERVLGRRGVVALASRRTGRPASCMSATAASSRSAMSAGSAAYRPYRSNSARPNASSISFGSHAQTRTSPAAIAGSMRPDQAPQVGALPRAGRARDQQVRPVQPDRERRCRPRSGPTGSARRSGHLGDGQRGHRLGQRVAADQLQHDRAGARGADPAQVRPEPVREAFGPVGEIARGLPGHQPDRHPVGAPGRVDLCRGRAATTRPR